MPRSALAVTLAVLALLPLACNVRRPPPQQPIAMPPGAYGLDPRATELLERCDAALRSHAASAAAAPSAPRTDALTALSQQRLLLVMALEDSRKQAATLEQRLIKARQGLRAQALSEIERALIAEALLDLDEGREPARPLGKRLAAREEFRDSVEAHALLKQNREKRAKLEAQIDALDTTFAGMVTTQPTPPGYPRFGEPPGRPIDTRL